MSSLARRIELYLKRLLDEAEAEVIELQRNELANTFECAPSQINYVLSTRFTPSHGYIVESRRGGGGFIRIVRLTWEYEAEPLEYLEKLLCFECNFQEAQGIIEMWKNNGTLTPREAKILQTITGKQFLNPDSLNPNILRAKILRAALIVALRLDLD